MSKQNRKSGARSNRTNLYSEITDKIIAEPEASRAADWIESFLSDETGSADAGTGDKRAA
ncbi:hypothetical protein FIV06_06990 [Labrenzia sp. THAF191b]|jgi:antirestriction protein ArdC|uniref:hypothetical protein n=1 Tax=Stappiaceae TaxID=2821832 RepID=UPI001267CB77|nr:MULTISPECIES: hypothetical protein [Stappiaceae]MBO9421676.1 hypothetical protein [Labrenzia sp. R4_2]QFS97159.1 hypothetical protein FIV06_06990 [Labrenzia sp. THAF191b]QFT03474.1 hypothetical protein FIV05_06990 [Labrenzia sp. THAF191a]QFT15016.1 hypothetical protein FIV03_06995 [Labrenzia sp. THAF187b]QFT66479.1 hypothetical protein FIU93_06800 [Labrenzia sp. THAF35]